MIGFAASNHYSTNELDKVAVCTTVVAGTEMSQV